MMDTQCNTNKYLILVIVTSKAVSSGSVDVRMGVEITLDTTENEKSMIEYLCTLLFKKYLVILGM